MKIYLKAFLIVSLLFIASCKPPAEDKTLQKEERQPSESIQIKYATGFKIEAIENGYKLTVSNPWPEAKQTYTYTLTTGSSANSSSKSQIKIPVNRLIATSTTHITPLVLLEEEESLVGFPSTDYISSPQVRKLIDQEKIIDLGMDSTMDVERILLTKPDLIMGYGVSAENPVYKKIQQAGIPVIFNGDWTEEHPLGKAEWIKLYGILFNKMDEANEIFNEIEQEYLKTKELVRDLKRPQVLAGATWKDTWYLPYGNSWQGQILNDAGGDYVYKETQGSGSLAYNIEQVITDARHADFWIAPAQYTSFSKMKNDHSAYALFDAFKNKKVFTFALNKGAEGGVVYYEEASMRPDLVLKDLVKILHPEAELDHKLYFFDPLEK